MSPNDRNVNGMTLHFPMVSNYPNYEPNQITLMSTSERVNAHPDYRGKGVQMAFVDSGFSNHPDLAGRIMLHVDASTDTIKEQPHVMETNMMSWHGQMTSVIGAGDGSHSDGRFRGIASEADLFLIKVSTPSFRIKERDILRGLQWIYDTRHDHNIRVVNVSVGGDWHTIDPSNPLHILVRRLVNDGITVVIASGNRGRDKVVPPASAPEAITVGGYYDHNTLNQDSWTLYHHNHGKVYGGKYKPELLAPAQWIASPLLPESETEAEIQVLAQLLTVQSETEAHDIIKAGQDALQLSDEEVETLDEALYEKLQNRIYHHKVVDANHQHVDGTSVASPIVASVIAQLLQINPALSPSDIREILTASAQSTDRFAPHLQGAGFLGARQAIEMVLQTA